ncbi:MAG: alpha/beta hydrolase [Leifsonia sp.]
MIAVVEHRAGQHESVLFLHGGNVAGWMWDAQVDATTGFHALQPDLPGFGASATEPWTSLAATADGIAALIRERAHDGRAHIVGLSLGGIVGIELLARYPELVRSALLSGTPIGPIGGLTRWSAERQLRFWTRRWYWVGLSRMYRIPEDAVDVFIETGLAIDPDGARRMLSEVYDGLPASVLDALDGCTVPTLALAGAREHRSARSGLLQLERRMTFVTTRIVPGMHHAWNAEDPALFNAVLEEWLIDGRPAAGLLPLGQPSLGQPGLV